MFVLFCVYRENTPRLKTEASWFNVAPNKVLNEIILNYLHRQECLCYGIQSGFGSTDILVCVPSITVQMLK